MTTTASNATTTSRPSASSRPCPRRSDLARDGPRREPGSPTETARGGIRTADLDEAPRPVLRPRVRRLDELAVLDALVRSLLELFQRFADGVFVYEPTLSDDQRLALRPRDCLFLGFESVFASPTFVRSSSRGRERSRALRFDESAPDVPGATDQRRRGSDPRTTGDTDDVNASSAISSSVSSVPSARAFRNDLHAKRGSARPRRCKVIGHEREGHFTRCHRTALRRRRLLEAHLEPNRPDSDQIARSSDIRGACGDSRTGPTKVPFVLPSSITMYSVPRWRNDACRWLTLGSGNRSSHPSPRPTTMRGASNVTRGTLLPSPERTRRVRAIGGRQMRMLQESGCTTKFLLISLVTF